MGKLDAPQANRLDYVRSVVEAVAEGTQKTKAIATKTCLTARHVRYSLHAARLLGLLVKSGSGHEATEECGALFATAKGSGAEREAFGDLVRRSPSLAKYAAAILGPKTPSRSDLANSMLAGTEASMETARRRVGTLLAWRRYLTDEADEPEQLRIEGWDWNEDGENEPPEPSQDASKARLVLHDDMSDPQDESEEIEAPQNEPDHRALSSRELPDEISLPKTSNTEENGSRSLTTTQTSNSVIENNDFSYLCGQMSRGQVILFTGAGFSLSANDIHGNQLPIGWNFANEMWRLCYPGEDYDESSLQDVFEHAQRYHKKNLDFLLRERFSIDSGTLPEWYQTWFSMPWYGAYTINVDDLELAVQRRFELPRNIRSISALRDTPPSSDGSLDVVHLNGVATDGSDGVTFSIDQFASRLARQEPWYARLSAEMLSRPFVFVGSPLNEDLLWQHIAMRRLRSRSSARELRPKSYLIDPKLKRARVDKLRAYNIIWIESTGEKFAREVLSKMTTERAAGHDAISIGSADSSGDERNIVEVADALLEKHRRTDFLMGEEPSWSDIRSGRAVARTEDIPRLRKLKKLANEKRSNNRSATVFAVSGTAGSGKTTFLMKAASALHGSGRSVAWIGADAEVAPRALVRYFRRAKGPEVLVVDDAGRYGSQLIPTILDLIKSNYLKLIVVGIRSHRERLLDLPGSDVLDIQRDHIGPLTNSDIDLLINALESERRLGRLRGMSPSERKRAFRDSAQRQILVAMIEATSGERFEDKVIGEWVDLEPTERYIYSLCALATVNGYPMRREDILVACTGGNRELDAIRKLERSRLLILDDLSRYRVRHRVIAEKLIDELASRGSQLTNLVVGLCRSLAIQTGSTRRSSSRPHRVLKRLLNHNTLLRLLEELEHAQLVFAELESNLDTNHHFWLQRGCLELECGDIRHAQNYLDQSRGILQQEGNQDWLVETAYAHMQLRKAIISPSAPDSADAAQEAFEALKNLVRIRGQYDHYPAHVFGSQALSWCRKAELVPRVRRELLREAKDVVEAAASMHRSRPELRQLFEDLRLEELRPR